MNRFTSADRGYKNYDIEDVANKLDDMKDILDNINKDANEYIQNIESELAEVKEYNEKLEQEIEELKAKIEELEGDL